MLLKSLCHALAWRFGGFMLGTEECQSGSGSKAESGAGNWGYGLSTSSSNYLVLSLFRDDYNIDVLYLGPT